MYQVVGWGNVMCWLFIGDEFDVYEVYCFGLVQEVIVLEDFFDYVIVFVEWVVIQVLLGVCVIFGLVCQVLLEGEVVVVVVLLEVVRCLFDSEDVKEGLCVFQECCLGCFEGCQLGFCLCVLVIGLGVGC